MKQLLGVFKYIKGYWNYAVLNIVFNILSVVFSLFSIAMIFPFLQILFSDNPAKINEIIQKGEPALEWKTNAIIDYVNFRLASDAVSHGELSVLLGICMIVIVSIFLKNLTKYLAMFFLAPIRNGVVRDIRNTIFNKTLQLPLSYYSDERKGDIISRMTIDVQEIEWSIMQSLEMIFREPLNIILFLIMMVAMAPQLTIVAFILLPLTAILIARIGKSLKRSSFKVKEKMGVLLSIMEETLGGLRIIKGFNAEGSIKNKFSSENQQYTRVMNRLYRKVDLASPLSEFLGITVFVVILYLGGKMVLTDKTMNGSIFITYLAIFSQLIPPAKSVTTAYYNVQKGLASAERIEKITAAPVTIQDPEKPMQLLAFEKEIEYKNVSFAYTRGDEGWALRNIDLKIQRGKTIALVGQSGSGKTTLADMLPRFYDATDGTILIDGISIKELKLADLRKLMGIVTQESILFNDTVFNNIAFGMENVREEDVIAAAQVANAHEFILQMPQGYQTNIGDRGGKMSGGQRQRISIARAVLKNPPILILDEATSALDTESERLVQDALNKLMKNRTSIVIAHRLSTIQHADEIIVLQKAQIVERGTHNQLLLQNGAYKRLYELQAFV